MAGFTQQLYQQMNSELSDLKLLNEEGKPVKAEDLVEVITDYAGIYGKCSPEEEGKLLSHDHFPLLDLNCYARASS